MIKRCIMIFPHFENMQFIDNLRSKYDPLTEHVRPHITLVFPFESDIESSKLKQHIENVISGIMPFEIRLSGITASTPLGNYLFLNIIEGSNQIVELNKRLYSDILEEFYPKWLNGREFLPHMTIGKISDLEAFNKAIEETKNIDDVFETTVDKISVEIIDENEDSIIEMEIILKG